ncbi:MAG: hypothetical protein WCK89_20755, partial [bacterium]
ITFSALCNYLARSPAFVRQVQNKLGLPVLEDDGYPATYVAFMETVLYLRIMGIRLEDIFDLFEIEKKILKLLKLDALSGSRLWYLDRCGVLWRATICRRVRELMYRGQGNGCAAMARGALP